MLALQSDNREIAFKILQKEGVDVNVKDEVSLYGDNNAIHHLTSYIVQNGCTALMMAAKEGHQEIVNIILEKVEVDVNIQDIVGSYDDINVIVPHYCYCYYILYFIFISIRTLHRINMQLFYLQ
jgi:ankyrin repeat protein